MAERKVVPFDEFYYQLKLMHLFQKHPVHIQGVPEKKDESITPLFIRGFSIFIHQIKWLSIGYKKA
jgi:hypothetical protein